MNPKLKRVLLWRPIEHPVYQRNPSFVYHIPVFITGPILLAGLVALAWRACG